jgi:hypothetical protein
MRLLADPELLAVPGGQPDAFLDWAPLEGYEMTMPHDWSSLGAAREALAGGLAR